MLLDSAHIAALALDIIEEHFGDVVQVPSVQLVGTDAHIHVVLKMQVHCCQ